MLSRILEPEVMDSADEAREYDAMDHGPVNRLFVADFLSLPRPEGMVLDVGTGTAQIPVELCRQCSEARVRAIDLAGHMLQRAALNVERAGLTGRVLLQTCDAKQMPFSANTFAAVISNSIVHHIPEPIEVFREMVRVAAPGGRLFIRDLLRPTTTLELRHLAACYAGEASPHARSMFEASLAAALRVGEVRDIVASLGFPAETVARTSDRHWTWSAVKPV
jgi:ubiquinone/menaquinone biosynthesis C-methylase UbiE